MLPEDADDLIADMKARVQDGEDPEELLLDECGLEPDYILELGSTQTKQQPLIMAPIDWKTIQQHYTNSNNSGLCFASGIFSFLWKWEETHKHIRTLAKEFLLETNQPPTIEVGVGYLFNNEESLKQVRTIREQFLQWCIDNNK